MSARPARLRPTPWARAPRDALGFLTRIPTGGASMTAAELSRAALFFPLVGLVVGGVAAATHAATAPLLPPPVPVVLALAAAILVTGGFHEDGLADSADALGAHVGRERRLEIMRDSRVGTFGALAVALPLLLATAALAPLGSGDFARAVLCAHVLGRWSTLPQARFLPPARADGSGAEVRVGDGTLLAGTLATVALLLGLAGPGPGASALAGAILLGLACGWGLVRVLGGVTGDTLGAVNKLTELLTYLVLVAWWAPS
jgi:adenosylcobinamide-GDP ribazoletransferase